MNIEEQVIEIIEEFGPIFFTVVTEMAKIDCIKTGIIGVPNEEWLMGTLFFEYKNKMYEIESVKLRTGPPL